MHTEDAQFKNGQQSIVNDKPNTERRFDRNAGI